MIIKSKNSLKTIIVENRKFIARADRKLELLYGWRVSSVEGASKTVEQSSAKTIEQTTIFLHLDEFSCRLITSRLVAEQCGKVEQCKSLGHIEQLFVLHLLKSIDDVCILEI